MNNVEEYYNCQYDEWDRLKRHRIEYEITKKVLNEYIYLGLCTYSCMCENSLMQISEEDFMEWVDPFYIISDSKVIWGSCEHLPYIGRKGCNIMDYAVVVYFDKNVDLSISRVMKNICHAGVNSYMVDVGIRPHITLAAFKDTNPQEFSKWLQTYAGNVDYISIKFLSIGVFPTNPSVLFLATVMKEEFINLHKSFNEQVKQVASAFENYYLPGNWVPHCTLATKLSQNELHRALDVVVGDFRPFTATITQIGLLQCNPFKEIVTYEIGKQVNV